jgi:glycine oxidase
MGNSPDVLIIGGGIIGLTTAYFLACDGVSVAVVDKGDIGQEASWAGAGILTPAEINRARTPEEQFLARSIALFPELSAELRERTGIDNGYIQCGGIEFVDDEETTIADEWRSAGADYDELDEPALRSLEPELASGQERAYSLPKMAQVRNPRHLQALLAACQSMGVRLAAGFAVHGFEQRNHRIVAVRSDAGPIAAERFLVSTGAWTEALVETIGWKPQIRPVRGQIALLNTSIRVLERIILRGARYIVPRADGRVLVGSTEEGVGFDKRTTASAIADLLTFACKLVPALGQAQVERCWAGLRPGTPDGRPYLGRIPGWENLFVAAGHYRSGIQLSPGTALAMKELLLDISPSLALDPFRPDRILEGTSRYQVN